MLPGVFGFKWTAGNLIFLGIFYAVVCVVLSTIAVAMIRAVSDFRHRKHDALRWKADFDDLPKAARTCRHQLTGELKHRVCPNGFDCRECSQHAQFLARASGAAHSLDEDILIFGYHLPLDRMYHRGHTWVRREEDGTVSVGLDDFAARLIGKPDSVELPAPGTRITVNGVGWNLKRGSSVIRILSPVDGEVVATGGAEQGWYLKIKPRNGNLDTRHLLRGGEIGPWIMKEMERLQLALSVERLGATLADGGTPVADLPAALPDADWDAVWGDLLLMVG